MAKKVNKKKKTKVKAASPSQSPASKSISEIKKKARSTERITTGVKGLDSLIEGGLRENSTNILSGGVGTGKTIFAVQFLIEGIKKGEGGIYITFEETKKKIYEDMLRFGWDLADYERKGKFVFLEYSPEQVKKVLTEGGGMVENIIEKTKAKRMVIDSITSFTLLYEDDLAKKEASLTLFKLIERWNCTGLLIAQEFSRNIEKMAPGIDFEVDGIILLYHVKEKGKRKRAIEILKMRGTRIPEDTYRMEITDDEGVVVYPNQAVDF